MLSGGGSSYGDKLYTMGKFSDVQAPLIPLDTAGLQRSAALYELATGIFTIATNNHVIPMTNDDFLDNTVFTFEGLRQITLSKNDIKFWTTNEELDATVIELSEECVKRLEQLGAKFLRLTTAREGDKIAMAQCPEGEVSIDKGDLIRRGTTSLLDIAVFHLATSR